MSNPSESFLCDNRQDACSTLNGESSILHIVEVAPWREPVDGAVLLDELRQTLKRFVVLPPWAAETLALWTLHTYAFEFRNVTTYIGIASPEKRCGKTTLLTVLSEMVNRAVVAANITSPAFFRVIEETRPTLLIDEVETYLQGNDELRGILNSGYSRKTAYVMRVAHQARSAERGMRNAGQYFTEGNEENEGEARGAERSTSNVQLSTFKGSGSRLARFSCWCP